jgi:ferredoxin
MADFCKQCADELGFPDGDLKNLTTEEDWTDGKAMLVICEGCGPTLVDPEGYCIGNCMVQVFDPEADAHHSPRKNNGNH